MEPLRRNLSGGVQATAADIYISYIHMYIIYTYISKTYIDAKFDVESFGMVYLASKGCLNKVICEKHTFLNVLYRSTVRVSHGAAFTCRLTPAKPALRPATCRYGAAPSRICWSQGKSLDILSVFTPAPA